VVPSAVGRGVLTFAGFWRSRRQQDSPYSLPMPFDPARYPDAITICRLVELRLPLAVHCHRCGRAEVFAADAFGLPPATYVPALGGRFRCTRCGSRQTEARPEYARPAAGPSASAWGMPPAE
jgi:hypothetical protein